VEYTSIKSDRELTRRDLLLLGLAVILAGGAYLAASALIYHIGYPLDDSWIHLTYARNLALHGQWAFQVGHPSAGSTAPLWTFLLAFGFWLHLGPYIWTYLLGGVTIFGLGVLAERTARDRVASYRPRLPWIGFFFVLEWHLLWAAMSGMETLLTGVLVLLISGSRRYMALGLLTGLSIWVRPDGLTLLGPVLVTILMVEKPFRICGRALLLYLIGVGSLFLPYLFFNLWLSGTPMPNTFYAKQTEYAAWQALPLVTRLADLCLQILTGPSVVLVPGVFASVILAARRRTWPVLAVLAWCFGYFLLYILRLPAYQHGRYLMPAMPIFFLFGLLPILEFQKSDLFGRRHWIVQTIWQSSLLLLTLAFLIVGARTYGEDVGLIESEMVVTARWAASNLPAQAVIAAHDIGALGYFDNHRLIDLAGLISPEVIPIMRDESRLAEFLDQHHADYLIAFPAFYPELTRAAIPIFTSGGRFAPEIGEQNMTVYRWVSP
jgi:hypothetical protein